MQPGEEGRDFVSEELLHVLCDRDVYAVIMQSQSPALLLAG